MSKIELTIADIHSVSQPSEAFSLILKEKEGSRYVPVIMGIGEVRTILVELNQSPTYRPLTHELFKSLANQLNCSLVEVNIVHYDKGVYYADMLMICPDQTTFHIDARPSDAIALALKFHAPFFMNTEIFEANCQEDNPESEEIAHHQWEELSADENGASDAYIDQKLKEMSSGELQLLLDGAVESEDFELALKIQAEIDQREAE